MKYLSVVFICCIVLFAAGCDTLHDEFPGEPEKPKQAESGRTPDPGEIKAPPANPQDPQEPATERKTKPPQGQEPGQDPGQDPGQGSGKSKDNNNNANVTPPDPPSVTPESPPVLPDPPVIATDPPTVAPDPPSNVSYFPVKFSTLDLSGNTVTEESLGKKEIFFVHYWATWCPPCIREMPELGEIVQKYSDRVGFIGLLDDYDTSRDIAVEIKNASGASFLNVDAYIDEFRGLTRLLDSGYVPTTVIIDSNGNMIGDQIIGAYGLGYAQFIESALNR